MEKTHIPSGQTLLVLKILLFVAAGLWIYSPAFHGAWLMDDDLYLPGNPLRHDPARMWKIWFAPGDFIEYYPIQETIQAIQWQLWGDDTLGYHLTNVLLHIANALLVWRLLAKFGLRLAWVAGLLFLIHPAAVESVAWISEFKNTLSLLPFLLAVGFWVDYEERKRPRDYFLALGFFLIAMLCKISMALFPVVILLHAWWKRGRMQRSDLVASAPFFVISLALGVTTILAGSWFIALHHSPPVPIPMGGIFWRLDLAGLASAFYLGHFFWPVPMDPMVAPWVIDPSALPQFFPSLLLLGGIVWFWTQRKGWGRHALLGLGFFLILLAPFLGFVSISYMKITWVFDHFLYLPSIGLIGLVVAALENISHRISPSVRLIGSVVVAILLGLLACESHAYARIFARPTIFYGYIVAHHPESWADHNSLGNVLRKEGRIPEAIEQFREAARLGPNAAAPLNNLGAIFMQSGRSAEAIKSYQQAIKTDPAYAEAHTGLGNTLLLAGQVPQAIEQFEEALKIKPDSAQARNSLSNALIQSGRLSDATTQSEEALKIAPEYVEGRCTLGRILALQGRIPEAIAQFEKALEFDPENARIQQDLASLRAQQVEATEKK